MIIRGNAIHIPLADNMMDCLVTDPPYGYAFMNKDWDKAIIGVETWKECLRVLKPGAFAFIMSSPRQDVLSRMIVNLQDAGFRTDFTSIYWTYASGFPKAKNLKDGSYTGFQPKPAVEVILVVMKPLSKKSFTDQALANGKGITWLDDCRIPFDEPPKRFGHTTKNPNPMGWNKPLDDRTYEINQKGRFPANLLASDDVLNDGKITKSDGGRWAYTFGYRHYCENAGYDHITENAANGSRPINRPKDSGSYSRYFDIDKWYDTNFPFLIIPKASKSEKNRGLDKWIYPQTETQKPVVNNHPTVKPLKLMSYLIMLGSRENDIILDPFYGSGTTGIAAQLLQRQCIGIELNQQYVEIAKARSSRGAYDDSYSSS